MPDPETIDEYLATLPDDRRAAMQQIREAVRAGAPDAAEGITYRMPGFKTHGRFLVSFDSFKRHYSLFPASDAVVTGLGDRVAPYLAGQGTIRFPADRPLPTDLITDIVRIRVVENDEAAAR